MRELLPMRKDVYLYTNDITKKQTPTPFQLVVLNVVLREWFGCGVFFVGEGGGWGFKDLRYLMLNLT